MEKVWLYALVAGVFPAIFWMVFWMKEDDDDMPEPKSLIIKTFILGGVSAFIALAVQAMIIKFQISKYGEVSGVILFAFVEEFLKFFVIYKVALSTRFNNERMDPVLYMIIGALGFAAVENIFYLIDYINHLEYVKSMIDGSYRFIGSTLVHTISSAFIGLACAFMFFKGKKSRLFALGLGLILATVMHSIFNFLVTSGNQLYKDIAFYGSWFSIIMILIAFEYLRRETRVRPRTSVRKMLDKKTPKKGHWVKRKKTN